MSDTKTLFKQLGKNVYLGNRLQILFYQEMYGVFQWEKYSNTLIWMVLWRKRDSGSTKCYTVTTYKILFCC